MCFSNKGSLLDLKEGLHVMEGPLKSGLTGRRKLLLYLRDSLPFGRVSIVKKNMFQEVLSSLNSLLVIVDISRRLPSFVL